MKLIAAILGLALAAFTSACSTGYSHWGVAPDDALGMTQADSACDFARGADDPGSPCYVSRRPWGDQARTE